MSEIVVSSSVNKKHTIFVKIFDKKLGHEVLDFTIENITTETSVLVKSIFNNRFEVRVVEFSG